MGDGRLLAQENADFRYAYNLTDHLGNVRCSFTSDANGDALLLQETIIIPLA